MSDNEPNKCLNALECNQYIQEADIIGDDFKQKKKQAIRTVSSNVNIMHVLIYMQANSMSVFPEF